MNLDILAIFAHPDDAELSCGGTLIKHALRGDRVGVIDLTRGELGSRGTAETRAAEAAAAAKIMGLAVRENLNFRDGFFRNDEYHQLKIIESLRRYRPRLIITNTLEDRHPDHGRAAELVATAAFLSGLIKIETAFEGKKQTPFRPDRVLHGLQFYYQKPQIVVDISEVWTAKMAAVLAYKSQFYNPNYSGDHAKSETFISQPHFIKHLEGRFGEFGLAINKQYAEGFMSKGYIGLESLKSVL